MKTFEDFIMSQDATFNDNDTAYDVNPREDFIADTQTLIRVKKFPKVTSWSELEFFVRFHRKGCQEAVVEARKMWDDYMRIFTGVTGVE
jgi:hypothetical protein